METWVFEEYVLCPLLSSYMTREFGVPQYAQSQLINHCSLQGDPGIQGIKGEKVREPLSWMPPLPAWEHF